jgi:hypothetical protein
MANQLNPIGGRKRIGRWTLATLLLTGFGCGFPHDRYGSDPLLGNFNRPIAPTPPIYTGGDPGLSPAYDGGARVGLPSPDVPARSNAILDRMFVVPTYSGNLGLGNAIYGTPSGPTPGSGGFPQSKAPSTSPGGTNSPLSPNLTRPYSTGAQLMSTPSPTMEGNKFLPGIVATPNSVTPRELDSNTMLTSGAMIAPTVLIPKPMSMRSSMRDPRTVATVEEGQSILQVCGAKSMVMESQPTGEWRFVCTVSDGGQAKNYEARSTDQIEAVRAVMWQLKNEP